VLAPTAATGDDGGGTGLAARAERFDVYVDDALGDGGVAFAATVARLVEHDLGVLSEWFDGSAPLGRLKIVLKRTPERSRAYRERHRELICDIRTVPQLEPRYSAFLAATLVVELWGEDHGGWPAGSSSLEALTRVLATALYPRQIVGFATAAVWLDDERTDYVNLDSPGSVAAATGCASLFLNYLHHQLGYPWREIVAAGAGCPAATARRLTGEPDDPFPKFRALLDHHFPPGQPAPLVDDNPFPLSDPAAARPPVHLAHAVEAPSVDLAEVLRDRRWLASSSPFTHVRADDVLRAPAYDAIVAHYSELVRAGTLGENIPGYDALSCAITSRDAGAFSVFVSRPWHDLWASVFGVEATGDLNVALHHHRAGSPSGTPHNDLNPGWFVDEGRSDGVNVHDPAAGDYRHGRFAEGLEPYQTIRAVALIYYFANAPGPVFGGETGLYRSASDPVQRPAVAVPPRNNSLVAFACTPFSFHSFLANPYADRTCLVMWLHQPVKEVVRRWGESSIVGWP
jgi:hypothetical protein